MKQILNAQQIRMADAHTIEQEPISSVDLMERAARAFCDHLPLFGQDEPILICCGTGNNGGDGLAIARILQEEGYVCTVWICRYNRSQTPDFERNYERLKGLPLLVREFSAEDPLPPVEASVVVDALLGSGLNKPIDGPWKQLVDHINRSQKRVIAVDIPTGMPADGDFSRMSTCVVADEVITFQRPKISFLFPESAPYIKRFLVADIGLDEDFIAAQETDFWEITEADIRNILKPRSAFSHKGSYGHSLLVAGSEQTMGAALLCAEACLHSGSGLTSLCIPKSGLSALNTRLPEVMAVDRADVEQLDLNKYDVMAVGPGLGMAAPERALLTHLLGKARPPLVLDADALNILSEEETWQGLVKSGTVLTPHMKEFDRLFGRSASWLERVHKAKEAAIKQGWIIVLKNRYTFIAVPNGRVYVNFTGNPAMASGGMGDVLTGMITAWIAQGYSPEEAAILGCYLHGKSGDAWVATEHLGVVTAGRLIQGIAGVIGKMRDKI